MRIYLEPETATFSRRLVAYVIDSFLIIVIWIVVLIVVAVATGDASSSADESDEEAPTAGIIALLSLPGVWFLYQWLSNSIGVSIGKKLMSLSVQAKASMSRPGLWRGLVRTGSQVLGSLPVFLGFFAPLWDPENAAWHDRLAGTRVVRWSVEGVEGEGVAVRPEGRNLRFACDVSGSAGARYVELRREGIRFEDERGLRGVLYDEIEGISRRPSGEIELRFKSRDMFGRPARESVLLAVQDAEPFILELASRVEAATGRRLDIPEERAGLQPPPT